MNKGKRLKVIIIYREERRRKKIIVRMVRLE